MKIFNRVAVVVFALSAISVSAYGADQKADKSAKSGATSFQTVDADGNGAISMDEARAVSGLDFAKADKNGDGQLSKSEFESATKAQGKSEKKSSKSSDKQ